MWKNDLHFDRQKAFGFDFKNFESISKAFYQWFVKKVKMKPMQLFHTCTTFLHQNFVTFRTCRQKWKLIMFSKQKWKRFVKEIRKMWKMTKNCSIWPLFSHSKWKALFYALKPETLRKPTVSGTFRYSRIMQVKQDFQLFIFSDKPNGISMILEPFCAFSQRH